MPDSIRWREAAAHKGREGGIEAVWHQGFPRMASALTGPQSTGERLAVDRAAIAQGRHFDQRDQIQAGSLTHRQGLSRRRSCGLDRPAFHRVRRINAGRPHAPLTPSPTTCMSASINKGASGAPLVIQCVWSFEKGSLMNMFCNLFLCV